MTDVTTTIDQAVTEALDYADLLKTKRLLRKAAKEAELNYDWLLMFRQRRINNPTISAIRKLLQHKQQQRVLEGGHKHTKH